MKSLPSIVRLAALALAGLVAGPAVAQVQLSETPPGPVGGVPATLPQIQLPDARDLKVDVPRPVRAAQAAMGKGRQRLALVVGLGTVGRRLVVDSAARDAQAVAAALRSGGFVVMQRSDIGAAELRSTLQEFRRRLQPGGLGFVYVTGLGVQVDGRNLLLARDAVLDPALPAGTLAAQLRQASVPLDEVTDALIGPADSPRLLVVDAAWKHPALARLPQPGLAEPRLPVGTMALFGHALGSVQDVPFVAPLPVPPPTDAVALAATTFARTLVAALLTPRISGPEALRSTRRSIVSATLGQASPWLGGDTESREELSEATLLDGLVPRTPEEIAREGARQVSRLMTRPGAARAGEMPVSEVLKQASETTPPEDAGKLPQKPGTAGSLGSAAGGATGALGTAVGVAAAVAGTVATAGAAEAALVASVAGNAATTAATTAATATTSVMGHAAALAARAASPEAATTPAAAAVRAAAALPPAAAPAGLPSPGATPAGAPLGTGSVPAAAPAPAVPATAVPAATAIGGALAADGSTNLARRVAQSALANAADAAAQDDTAQGRPASADDRTRRHPDGGERPAFTPRVNPYGHAEGDTTTWRVTDKWKGEVSGEYTTAIEQVLDDGRLVANGRQMELDAQGRVTRRINADGGVSQFEPAQAWWWAKPEVGERRIVKYLEKFNRADGVSGETEWRGRAQVGRLRKIATPAGEFEVLPVESSGWWYAKLADGTRRSGQWSRTAYYAPRLGQAVAVEIENLDHLGKPMKLERIDLLQAQTARVPP